MEGAVERRWARESRARLAIAQRTGDTAKVEKLTKQLEEEKAAPSTADSGSSLKKKYQTKLDKRQASARQGEASSEPVYSSTLPCDPALFGKLRIRCWSYTDSRPSESTELHFPRYKGNPEVDIKQQMVIDARAEYFQQRCLAHVSPGFEPVGHRIGNPAGKNEWGGDVAAPPPPPSAKEKAMGNVMAPIPYDMPRLPKSVDGLTAAANALASFYRLCGVPGGGAGTLFHKRIDHVLHAIAGTPTENGESSPRRTVAGLGEPLMALAEVIYADVLVELFAKVPTLKAQWQFLEEKVYGVVGRMVSYNAHYTVCEPHVKDILFVMIEVWETLRQCQPEEVRIRIRLVAADVAAAFLPFCVPSVARMRSMMSAEAAPLLGYPVPLTAIAPPPSLPPRPSPPVAPPALPPIRRFSSTSNTRITRGSSQGSRPGDRKAQAVLVAALDCTAERKSLLQGDQAASIIESRQLTQPKPTDEAKHLTGKRSGKGLFKSLKRWSTRMALSGARCSMSDLLPKPSRR